MGLSLASPREAAAQALPVSDPLVLSGTKLIPSEGRLYFGDADRPYEYDPAAPSRSGRGLVRAVKPLGSDWQAFLRTNGRAFLPIVGGMRDGKECYRGMRRFDPGGEGLAFVTKACLLPNEFPAVLAGAENFHIAGGRLYYTRHGAVRATDGTATGDRWQLEFGFGHTPISVTGTRALIAGGRNRTDWSIYEINEETGLTYVGYGDELYRADAHGMTLVAEGGWRTSNTGVELYFDHVVVGTGIIGSKVALMGRNLKRDDVADFDPR